MKYYDQNSTGPENPMLEELHVHNYALIDRVSIKFTQGLNILSGETGAGKSILIGALGLLLGQKAEASIIRTGTEETLVSAVVNVAGNRSALDWLSGHDISPEDGNLILRRTVKKNGRGSIYIQSVPVTRSTLQEMTSMIFDMHGQHEHQSLLQIENHRKVLDFFAGCGAEAQEFSGRFMELKALRDRYTKLLATERERLRQVELLKHAIAEIGKADLKPREDEELEQEHKLLANYERLFQLLEQIHGNVAESRGGALASLRTARRDMEELSEIDPNLSAFKTQLEDSYYELEDFSEGIRHFKDQLNFDSGRLSLVEDRLSEIRLLKKKYGDTIDEILKFFTESKAELEAIENWEEDKEVLKRQIAEQEKQLALAAQALSEKRKSAAAVLEKKVEDELKQLGMPKVRFKVMVSEKLNDNKRPVISQHGKDEIEYVISPNLGEPFKKLRSIVSGGELSRVMLAIKSALAETDDIDCLIFDEVDAGIGGQVAVAVGERLKYLSQYKQILCITHLATIAVRAQNHIKVEKVMEQGRTFTRVKIVSGQERKEEVARMLAGDKKEDVSLKHAEELILKYGS
jgi:DNA repair protein RecN (Recombination protein N)